MSGLTELLGLVLRYWWAVVIGGIFGVWGAVELLKGSNESAFGLVVIAVVALAVALALALNSMRKQRDEAKDESGVTHIYQAPVTFNVGTTMRDAPSDQARTVVGPQVAQPERPVISLAEHVEFRDDRPPIIENKVFRNAKLRGPIVLYPNRGSFVGVGWGIANGDPETMLWEVPDGAVKFGVTLLDNCVFEDCITEHVGIAGTRQQLDEFRRKVEGS